MALVIPYFSKVGATLLSCVSYGGLPGVVLDQLPASRWLPATATSQGACLARRNRRCAYDKRSCLDNEDSCIAARALADAWTGQKEIAT